MKNQHGPRPLSYLFYPLISGIVLSLLLSLTPLRGRSSATAQANSQVYLPVIAPGQGVASGTPTGEKPGEKPTATAIPATPDAVVTPSATPTTSQPVETPTPPPTPHPATPYAALLTQARARCQATRVNHACLAQGTAAGFSQVGETIAFTQPLTLSVRSSGVGVEQWSVLLLRLQAPGEETITQTLDLLAVGHVDLSVLQLFTSTEVAPGVPVVRFASQPLHNGTASAPSGLIVQNEVISELLSIEVNGAGITLDGAAFLSATPNAEIQSAEESQPANEMVVHMRQGSAMVQAADQASAVVAGSQVAVALNAQGVANAAPGQTEASADDDLIVPLVSSRQETFNRLFSQAFTKIVECTEFKYASRVYSMYYYLRQLNTPKMRPFLSEELWAKFADQVTRCARFEVIFDSTIVGNTTLTWRDQVHSDGTFVQFDINGDLVTEASSPLKHLQVGMSVPVCHLQSIAKPDGTFAVTSAKLRIHYNTMKVSMKTFPYMTLEQIPTGTFICPAPAPPLIVPIEWNTMFIQLHPELWLPQPIYLLQEEHWKYTGRQIFAEAIFAGRSAPFADGMIYSDSYFILRHAPVE